MYVHIIILEVKVLSLLTYSVSDVNEERGAATRIQSVFRGQQHRVKVKITQKNQFLGHLFIAHHLLLFCMPLFYVKKGC
jgi:hypothetical protein